MKKQEIKNKRIKKDRGITLVALIITIIVLLILAVVAISAVSGDGIIGHAKNARDAYNEAQISENGILQNYSDYITSQVGNNGGSSQPETNPDDESKKITFSISSHQLEAEEGMKWEEWITSKYYKDVPNYGKIIINGNGVCLESATPLVYGTIGSYNLVKSTDEIVNGRNYEPESAFSSGGTADN